MSTSCDHVQHQSVFWGHIHLLIAWNFSMFLDSFVSRLQHYSLLLGLVRLPCFVISLAADYWTPSFLGFIPCCFGKTWWNIIRFDSAWGIPAQYPEQRPNDPRHRQGTISESTSSVPFLALHDADFLGTQSSTVQKRTRQGDLTVHKWEVEPMNIVISKVNQWWDAKNCRLKNREFFAFQKGILDINFRLIT